ncbi:hypothetical protein D9M72_427930 [compost metagenome]
MRGVIRPISQPSEIVSGLILDGALRIVGSSKPLKTAAGRELARWQPPRSAHPWPKNNALKPTQTGVGLPKLSAQLSVSRPSTATPSTCSPAAKIPYRYSGSRFVYTRDENCRVLVPQLHHPGSAGGNIPLGKERIGRGQDGMSTLLEQALVLG